MDSICIYPNVSREIMGSNNPYIDHLKEALAANGFQVDPSPANNAFYDLLKKGFRSDLVVLNWIENIPSRRLGFLQTILLLLYMPLLKICRVRIIWIKHNKLSHSRERLTWKKILHRVLAFCADHIIVHSLDTNIADTRKLVYIPHPNNIPPEDIIRPGPAEEAPVIDLLIWGTLFPYKGVLEFLQFIHNGNEPGPADQPGLKDLRIYIAGKCADDYWKELAPYAGPRIQLVNKFINEDELTRLFNQSRFILFTYRKESVMSSGSLIDSLVACKKIIAPDCGAFRDLAEQHQFVCLYDDYSGIAALYRDNYDNFRLDYDEVRSFVTQNSWYNMGSKIKELTARIVLCCLIGLTAPAVYCQQPASLTFYVAATGSSSNPGTIAKPFLQPEDAWTAISKIPGAVDAKVYIRGGDYSFSNSWVLAQERPDPARHTVFAGYRNEKVLFTGGSRLDNAKFSLVSDPGILNRLPSIARGKVYVIDLKAAGITDYGKMVPHGYKSIRPAPLELFYNRTPLTIARYPNEGYLPIGTVSDPGSNPRQGDRSNRGATFAFPDSRIDQWRLADNAWVGGYFSYGYSDDYLKVDAFDLTNKTIRLKQPAMYSVFGSDNTSNDILKNSQKMRGYYIYNLLEELDSPGEWFLDESSGRLYCWPPDNAIRTAAIEVSLLEDPIVVLYNTENVSFSGIAFTCSRGMGILLEGTKNTLISHCTFDDLGTVAISTGDQLREKPIRYSSLPGGGSQPGAGAAPAYNTNLLIQSCRIDNTGTGGVILDGGDKITLTAARNVLDNCEIYNFSRINRTYCPGVSLNGVGNTVTHCYIHDAPDQAILFWGNDHTISFNHIKNVVSYMTDAGAVYTGRDLASAGDTIDYNFFDHISSLTGYSTCAVYLDDGSSGMEVDGNVFYKTGTPGTYHFGAVHINGGSDNYFRNNYMIDCQRGFSGSPWPDTKWKGFITDPGIGKVYRPGVDLHAAVYAKKYPFLARLTDSNTLATRRNYSFNTLAWNVDAFSSATVYVHENTFITQQDPGFADPNKPDFTLVKTPPALEKAGDWKPVPFREIGIQNK